MPFALKHRIALIALCIALATTVSLALFSVAYCALVLTIPPAAQYTFLQGYFLLPFSTELFWLLWLVVATPFILAHSYEMRQELFTQTPREDPYTHNGISLYLLLFLGMVLSPYCTSSLFFLEPQDKVISTILLYPFLLQVLCRLLGSCFTLYLVKKHIPHSD